MENLIPHSKLIGVGVNISGGRTISLKTSIDFIAEEIAITSDQLNQWRLESIALPDENQKNFEVTLTNIGQVRSTVFAVVKGYTIAEE